MRAREAVERECVGVCEGGSGLLGGMEAVRIESWRVEPPAEKQRSLHPPAEKPCKYTRG